MNIPAQWVNAANFPRKGGSAAPYVNIANLPDDLTGQQPSLGDANNLAAMVAILQAARYKADEAFSDATAQLQLDTVTSDELSFVPLVSNVHELTPSNFTHSWAVSFPPGIKQDLYFTRGPTPTGPGQYQFYNETFVESDSGWITQKTGSQDAIPALPESIQIRRGGRNTFFKIKGYNKIRLVASTDAQQLVTVVCDPYGVRIYAGLPFKEPQLLAQTRTVAYLRNSTVVVGVPGVSEITMIAGYVHAWADTNFSEFGFHGDVEKCARLSALELFYTAVRAAVGQSVIKAALNASSLTQKVSALTPALNARMVTSLAKNAIMGISESFEAEAPFASGQTRDNAIHGVTLVPFGGDDSDPKELDFILRGPIQPFSPWYEATSSSGVKFRTGMVVDEFAGWSTGTGVGQVTITANHESGYVNFTPEDPWNNNLYVSKRVEVFLESPTVAGAGFEASGTATYKGKTYQLVFDVTEEDDLITAFASVTLEQTHFEPWVLQNFTTYMGTGCSIKNQEQCYIGETEHIYGYDGPDPLMVKALVDYEIGTSDSTTYLHRCKHRLSPPWNTNLSLETKPVINVKVYSVPPVTAAPVVVDTTETIMFKELVLTSLNSAVNSVDIRQQDRRIEEIERRTRPTVAGFISTAAFTAASFLNPGVGLTAALLVGTVGEAVESFQHGYTIQSIAEMVTAGLVHTAQRRVHGKDEVDESDDFLVSVLNILLPSKASSVKLAEHRTKVMKSIERGEPLTVPTAQGFPVGHKSLSLPFVSLNNKQITPIKVPLPSEVPPKFQPYANKLENKGMYPIHQSVTANSVMEVGDQTVGFQISLGVSDGVQRGDGVFPSRGGVKGVPSEPGCSFFLHDGGISNNVLSIREFTSDSNIIFHENRAFMAQLGFRKSYIDSLSPERMDQILKIPTVSQMALKTVGSERCSDFSLSLHSMASIVQSHTGAAGREMWGYNVLNHNCRHYAREAFETIMTGTPQGQVVPWFHRYIKERASNNMSREEFVDVVDNIYQHIYHTLDDIDNSVYDIKHLIATMYGETLTDEEEEIVDNKYLKDDSKEPREHTFRNGRPGKLLSFN